MKNTIILIMLVMLSACSVTSQVSGSHVSLNAISNQLQAIPSEQVTIFLETPQPSYQTIALVSANATISGYSNVSAMEAELLEELRRQAASIGANGVMNIVREVMSGDQVITTSTWGTTARATHELTTQLRQPILDRQRQSVVSSDYLIIYRGQAISY